MTDAAEDLPAIIAIESHELRPGDVLVVKIDRHLSPKDARNLTAKIAAVVGADVKILVLDRGATLGVVRPVSGETPLRAPATASDGWPYG